VTFQFSAQDIPSNVSNHIALTVNVPGYLLIYKCRNAGSVGGGVGLLEKDTFDIKILKQGFNNDDCNATSEAVFVEILCNDSKNIIVGSVYAEKFIEYKQNVKYTWKLIRSVLNQPLKQKLPTVFEKNGNIIEGYDNIVEEFNDYFVNIGRSLSAKVPEPDHISSRVVKHATEYLADILAKLINFYFSNCL